ncbi:nuclear pore complex protein NUP85 isoform X2 [Camellia sinensis]|uniref:nuclear pore complex protein NUP85 isoform X1 n=1 Tax=Camellia sinensis TaxID=4442 RepID=UPI001035BC91|nr:nuclear pore complex protein NUP85 isoform X1 [Camellia sinensis]XP_028056571.1 nuclear pore complex protein NUP85 isoform X2 [Camellia sinensis]
MPGISSESGESSSLVPFSPEVGDPVVYPLHHGLKPPISRLSISWSRGNSLRVSVFLKPQSDADDSEIGGKVVEVKLGSGDGEIDDAQWRRIAYGSVSPFALLQSRKNSMSALSKMSASSSAYEADWWEYVMEYSSDINFLLGGQKLPPSSVIEDPKTILKKVEEPTCLKSAWELLEIFYADKHSQAWMPERLLDWLADYDSLLSGTQPTVNSKLVNFQKDLVSLQAIEDDPKYWEAMSSPLAVGWLDIAVKMLHLHGSYQLDQLGNREIENGLVEAVAVLISKMPRLRPELAPGKLGECYKTKPDFIKAWEKWRAQLTKLDCSTYWVQCDHNRTKEGLKYLLQIMLGNANILSSSTCNWIELHISHLLYIRPFTMGLESMYSLAQKCMQLKPMSSPHKLMGLLIGILAENTEVVLAECSRSFGPWMVAHAIELLTAGSTQAEILLHEERYNLGGISMEELHRLVYAQVLSSHALTWQIAPIYLTSCMKQGMGLLEILLYKQPVQHNQLLLKNIEICRLYELDSVSSKIMKIAGVHHWKHGKKGSGVFWLQQAQDEVCLNRIAQQLFNFVGKSISDESLKQWEGLIELLGSESRTAGGLEFLHKYRDFKRSLQQVHDGIATDAAQKAVESLISLMKNPSTPQRFWLPLLYDSLKLLNWQDRPLLNVSQTNLLLNKLQELSMARLRPDFIEADLPSQALSSVRLALATNLGRAILEE